MSQASQQASQAPQIGRLARTLGRFHVTGVFWYRFHAWGARIAPLWLFPIGVHAFTFFFSFALRRIGRAVADNLEPVLGPTGRLERQRRIHRTLLAFAWCLTERYERLAVRRPIEVRTTNREAWDCTAGGMVLVTAHVGNWEVGSGLPSSEENRRIHVVREKEMDPRAQEFIRKLVTERMGPLYTTHFASDDPSLGLELLEALGRGEIVALQGDRPRAGGRGIQVRLLDRPFELPAGPLVLARTAGVPILPVFTLREGRLRYRLSFRDPIHVASTKDRGRDLQQAGQALATQIEWAVREAPHQWFCFRSLWNGQARNGPRH